jgi:hypothetical protein
MTLGHTFALGMCHCRKKVSCEESRLLSGHTFRSRWLQVLVQVVLVASGLIGGFFSMLYFSGVWRDTCIQFVPLLPCYSLLFGALLWTVPVRVLATLPQWNAPCHWASTDHLFDGTSHGRVIQKGGALARGRRWRGSEYRGVPLRKCERLCSAMDSNFVSVI